ncbi:hypothetical protein ADICYQ_1011 [Cyclobacterium qasimii M12-11B]|uniref:Uncharacterized protein n=2 Tax=Cyclobacterium qasimii TaxID=1350429 RepID=S7VME0_9BACT|nr:hypothetical protein ADICYQ_1011 [Cyclobacterium qasimii M12-11B]GEO22240.1 hypothetical protein CQA01_27740 [Cyclobacterium qasimii]
MASKLIIPLYVNCSVFIYNPYGDKLFLIVEMAYQISHQEIPIFFNTPSGGIGGCVFEKGLLGA